MTSLQGKVAIVIGAGATGNLGQVLTRLFVAHGVKVMAAGRKEEPLKQLAADTGCAWALCDLTRKDEVEALVKKTVETFGGVDFGINSTGWGLVKEFTETTPQELEEMTKLQFIGPFYFFQELIKAMTQRGGGSIVQVSSATAKIMMDDHAAYMGTKAGLDHVIRCIANQYGEKGIKANSVSPGFTKSPMTERAAKNTAVVEAFRKEYPLGRIGTLEDTAEAILWLCDDRCFLTGENLQVNGGLTLRRNPRNDEIVAAAMAERARREAAKAEAAKA